MKKNLSNQWFSLGLALAFTAPAFAMGPKPPQPEASPLPDPQVVQAESLIDQNQAQIDKYVKYLNLSPDNFPTPADATLGQLNSIIQEQQSEISNLEEKKHFADNQELAGEIKKENEVVKNDQFLQTQTYEEHRCDDLKDSIPDEPRVQGRNQWAGKCIKNYLDDLDAKVQMEISQGDIDPELEERDAYMGATLLLFNGGTPKPGPVQDGANRYFYASFGVSNNGTISNTDPTGKFDKTGTVHFVAPENFNASCSVSYDQTHSDGSQGQPHNVDLLNDLGFKVVAMCLNGCYTPDQKLAFSHGYQAIGEAFMQKNMEIMAVTADSTLDSMKFEPSELKAYTVDIQPSWQEVIDFETLSGHKLTVTLNHPLLDSQGMMRQARDLKVGDSLLAVDGPTDANPHADPIVSANERNYYGKVYNVRITNSNPVQNIVIANGILSGSVYFQNEGTKDLNRELFRMNLERNLVQN